MSTLLRYLTSVSSGKDKLHEYLEYAWEPAGPVTKVLENSQLVTVPDHQLLPGARATAFLALQLISLVHTPNLISLQIPKCSKR